MAIPDEATTTSLDHYASDHLIGPELQACLDATIRASDEAGLPEIQVSTMHGVQLMVLARALGARSVLEVGTLGGFSTILLAKGVGAAGRVLTLELSPKHAEVARENLARAGVGERVEVRVGDALESMESIRDDAARGGPGLPPFDLVFIDADKDRVPEYLEIAIGITRPGGMIIVDNTVRGGRVLDPETTDASVRGVQRMYEMLKGDRRVAATAMQTIGAKGWDGYTMVVVNPSDA